MGVQGPARILAVDDDRSMLMLLSAKLKHQGHDVVEARDGKEACDKIQKEKDSLDVILLDREMPEMDGMEVTAWMKKDAELSKLPVIMQTGSNRPEQVTEGIDAGVFYYLTKPIQDEILKSVLTAAIRESRQQKALRSEMKRHGTSFRLMDNSKYTLSTLEDAEDLACFIANCFPEPEKTLPGLAELLINAVEHGSCQLSYDEKSELIEKGAWREEVIKRVCLPENKDKEVQVFFVRTAQHFKIKIIDEGDGFDWEKYMKVDPARASDNHGRGIAQANMNSFDQIKYNTKGNEVNAVVDVISKKQDLDW